MEGEAKASPSLHYTCMHVGMHACMFIGIYIYIYICVCMNMDVCMYISGVYVPIRTKVMNGYLHALTFLLS